MEDPSLSLDAAIWSIITLGKSLNLATLHLSHPFFSSRTYIAELGESDEKNKYKNISYTLKCYPIDSWTTGVKCSGPLTCIFFSINTTILHNLQLIESMAVHPRTWRNHRNRGLTVKLYLEFPLPRWVSLTSMLFIR